MLAKNKIRISILTKTNLNMTQLIPEWVISYAVENTTCEMFQNVKNLIENFEGSEYEVLMKEKPEFFQYL